MGYEPPPGWTEFEAFLSELKARGVVPLALGSSFGWPALARISYIDMRFNGLTAHLELLEGKRDSADPSLKPVFETLERWRNNGWFDADSYAKNWPEALVDVDSGKAAFNLMGAFAVNRFARPQTVGFFPVPMIKAIQAKVLAEAKGTVPQMDRIFSNQAAYDANQAVTRFFQRGPP